MARPPIRVGDSVDIVYSNGRRRVGAVQDVEYAVAKVLIGGAEGHASMSIGLELFRAAGSNHWRVEMDVPSATQR